MREQAKGAVRANGWLEAEQMALGDASKAHCLPTARLNPESSSVGLVAVRTSNTALDVTTSDPAAIERVLEQASKF